MAQANAGHNAGAWDEIISSYSRADAIEDGVLVDITEIARESGFKWPAAMTHAAWIEHIKPPAIAERYGETDRGRLLDMLNMARLAIRTGGSGDRVHFVFLATDARGHRSSRRLWLKVGPGDTPEPVITIMQEGED